MTSKDLNAGAGEALVLRALLARYADLPLDTRAVLLSGFARAVSSCDHGADLSADEASVLLRADVIADGWLSASE